MRMSCNGCRVLRKGCSDNCSIRPCLEWIKSPDSQANATLFLAKFYGRAGLMNLINAGPPHLRPALFRSLLYEACGRFLNPIHGSAGLMWSGSWQLCHNAVEAVLRGAAITQMATEIQNGPPFKAYDIRHVNKEHNHDLHRVRSRRSASKSKRARLSVFSADEVNGSPSHGSSLSHQSEAAAAAEQNVDREILTSGGSAKAEPALDSVTVREYEDDKHDGEMELELTLGLEPLSRRMKTKDSARERGVWSAASFPKMELRLDCPACL